MLITDKIDLSRSFYFGKITAFEAQCYGARRSNKEKRKGLAINLPIIFSIDCLIVLSHISEAGTSEYLALV